MDKIATTVELRDELVRLMGLVTQANPSREKIAAELITLAGRVAEARKHWMDYEPGESIWYGGKEGVVVGYGPGPYGKSITIKVGPHTIRSSGADPALGARSPAEQARNARVLQRALWGR